MIGLYNYLKEFIRKRALRIFLGYNLPRWVVFIVDNTLVFLLFLLASTLRYNFASTKVPLENIFLDGLLVTLVYILFSFVFRSYAGILRHTTLTDITLIFVVTTSSLVVTSGLSFVSRLFMWSDFLIIPISVILVHYVSVTVTLFIIRLSIRIIFRFATMSKRTKKRVLIYGAGEMGFIVKRVLLSDPVAGFEVKGFIDDNKRLQGLKINGIPVFKPEVFSSHYILKHKIKTLIIAISNISAARKGEIISYALESGLEILETPSIENWLNGHLEVNQLKKVKLEDLLGRDSIELNMELIGIGLKDKTVMVTGAAGSIGSEIVRQLARFNSLNLILVDQAETPMFYLDNELKSTYSDLRYNLILADITDSQKMEVIFKEYHPELVFHAAAYKHVSMMEENPDEAFRVNIGGTRLVTKLSVKYGVEKFVMISTDKSVYPSSVMGASKRVCEMMVQSIAQKKCSTQFVITRFGNVLGSNGSVIPIFEKQINDGGPVTVTHPEVTRYFMTIREACELVLEAGFMGNDNEIFVFDMGTPVPIVDMAYQMIRLSGFVPEKDIEVHFTGLRPGEKLFEELLTEEENTLPTYHPKIKVARVEEIDGESLLSAIDPFLNNIYKYSHQDIVSLISKIVPDYKCSNNNYH